MKRLLTIGYEGALLNDFLQTLQDADVDVLLDIREVPYSRRAEFSKNALIKALSAIAINYRHEQNLGSPRTIRDRVRRDGDRETFKQAFNRHLKNQNSLLLELAGSLTGNIVLLCYEKDYRLCHRQLVAAAFAEITGLTPRHLVVKPDNQQQDLF